MRGQSSMSINPSAREIQVVHPAQRRIEASSGAMIRYEGVSQSLCGAEGIHLGLSVLPPGCRSSAHWHANCESALYVLRGRGRFLVGGHLDKALEIAAGDFLYVPPEAVHIVESAGPEPLELVVARNAPVEIVVEASPKLRVP